MRGAVELLRLSHRQWLSPHALERIRAERLRRLVRHAGRNVPLYRDLFGRAGVRPEEILDIADLQRLPVVTREMIQRASPSDLIAHGIDRARCMTTRTSGSTGKPLEIVCTRRERSRFSPSFFRPYLAWGLRPHHRLTYFQARKEVLDTRSWYEKLGLFRRQTLFSGDEPRVWMESIRRWRPFMVHGYSMTLKLLADAARSAGSDLRVPLVVTTSGVIDESGRSTIESALGARVADIYASEEAGTVIAWECPVCPGYHVCIDSVVVEFLHEGRPAKPGEEASVIITNLNNFTMPFIRYDQGDIVRLSEHRPICGRGLPLIDSIRGRAGDYIVLPSGRRLTPHSFFLVLDHAVGVGQWQIVQEERGRIVVRMAPARPDLKLDVDGLVEQLREIVGAEVLIDVSVTRHLMRGPAYKHRSVVSNIEP